MTPTESRAQQLDRYLQAIAGGRCGGEMLEIRYATGHDGMRRLFVAARRLDVAARAIRSLAPRTDVYCGVLLRSRRAGGRDAVTDSHLVFVEIDEPDALGRLARFAAPSMIVASGIIRSRRVWACSAWGNAGWRHVVDRADGVDARGARTTYDMYDLSVGGFDRRGQTMLVADGGVDER